MFAEQERASDLDVSTTEMGVGGSFARSQSGGLCKIFKQACAPDDLAARRLFGIFLPLTPAEPFAMLGLSAFLSGVSRHFETQTAEPAP
jgi:hypothetical protein